MNLSIISHKGFRTNALKRIWLSFPREISSCCVIILSRNQRALPASETLVSRCPFFVTLTWDWLAVAFQLSVHNPSLEAGFTIITSRFYWGSPPTNILNPLCHLIIIYKIVYEETTFQFPSNQLEMLFLPFNLFVNE